MRLALDTNRYVDAQAKLPAAVRAVEDADEILLPFVVVAELRVGFLGGNRPVENERLLGVLLAKPNVSILHPDDQTTHHYARLYQQLRRQGTPIPTNDVWIAALVVQHGLILYARDRHFDHLPQIPRL